MLALARVLALEPRLLVVDERSFEPAPVVVDEADAAPEGVLAAGTSLVPIEPQVDRAEAPADDVVVLSEGRVVYDGLVAAVNAAPVPWCSAGPTPGRGRPTGSPGRAASRSTGVDGTSRSRPG